MIPLVLHVPLTAYIVAFGGAGVACLLSLGPARRIDDPDTRRGLAALLLTSGGWAFAQIGFLAAPTPALAVGFHVVGLVVGFAAVGPWLYFCSAYTDRTIHRNPTVRRAAVGLFLVVALVKVTNQYHGLYFTAEFVTEPFSHLAIRSGVAHWVVMGIAYALAAVGYFVLFERFTHVDYDTRPLAALVAVTGLPVVVDVVAATTPFLVEMSYEPLGVAVFAVGATTTYLGRFQTVQITGGQAEPAVVLDDENRVREFNAAARALFPALDTDGVLGEPVGVVLPVLTDHLGERESLVALERDGETRYYGVRAGSFAGDGGKLGRLVTVNDVTGRERDRHEIERRNDRLAAFTSVVSHDLRNPLGVARGRVELGRETGDAAHFDRALDALNRMDALVEDLLTLARQGRPIDDVEPVVLSDVAWNAWAVVEADGATLRVDGDRSLLADRSRLQQLLENLFRNSVDHGTTDDGGVTVTVTPLDDGFAVADDGPGIDPDERARVFDSGYTTSAEGTGFGLAIVSTVADAHGWAVAVTESETGGVRFEVTGVRGPDE